MTGMNDADIARYIREEVKKQLNIILNAETSKSNGLLETIANLFPGMANLPDRPIVLPYGFSSAAPPKTISVTAKVGDHPANRMVIGHRDANRPSSASGEMMIYSKGGYRVVVKNGAVMIGKGNTLETAVAGDALVTLLGDLGSLLAQHTHPAPGAPPVEAAQFSQLGSDAASILAKDGGAF